MFGAKLRHLLRNRIGSLAWNVLTTSARDGKAIRWEAVRENGWVEGYRMLDADLASLAGQQVAVPTGSGSLLLGKVEGDRILITNR